MTHPLPQPASAPLPPPGPELLAVVREGEAITIRYVMHGRFFAETWEGERRYAPVFCTAHVTFKGARFAIERLLPGVGWRRFATGRVLRSGAVRINPTHWSESLLRWIAEQAIAARAEAA